MQVPLSYHELHANHGARFGAVSGMEVVADYGDTRTEQCALRDSAGLLDLSFRGRICLTGMDRVRLLNGQVTNDIQKLRPGEGCYAALVTAKGKFQCDLHVYALEEELLLDFEPGLTGPILERFEHYIVADDVQAVDVAPFYGLLSVQGPRATEVLDFLELGIPHPTQPHAFSKRSAPDTGDLYVVCHPRLGTAGYDFFVPEAAFEDLFAKLSEAVSLAKGRRAGWSAFEQVRIEAGIPRFPVDMDETNLAPEAGDHFVQQAISYSKGCYIGQEVIARIRTYGQVAKALRGLRLPAGETATPCRGDRLFKDGREVGYVTSSVVAPSGNVIAMGYVRKECHAAGSELTLKSDDREIGPVTVTTLPFPAA